jgi:ubiquinone/menaquinone biosynthesis C-methylase UbiE
MSQPKRADSRYLREVAYADPSGFEARASLFDFQQPHIDLQAEALEVLGPLDGRLVADIGCGSGRYLGALRGAGARVVGVDLSVGMLAAVPDPPALLAADAQALPLTDAAIDVVMMMHMLYHVPDPALAVAEAARVLRRGGRLLVATNGRRHLAEMNELWFPLLDRTGKRGSLEDTGLVNPRVTADEAHHFVAKRFPDPDVHWLRSSVIVTDAAPVARHAASTTAAQAVGEHREEIISELSDGITSRIRREGQFTITTEVAFVTATNS